MAYQVSNCLSGFNNKNSIFNEISSAEKDILKKNHTCIFYNKGEYIFKKGEIPTGLICLLKGKVQVFSEGIGGREQIIRMVNPIGLIGFRAVFTDETYKGTAEVIEDATICTVEKESLFNTIRSNGELGLKFIQMLSSELGFSNQRTISLTQKHVRARIAESLLFLQDTYGFEEDNATLSIYLSRENIANLSNMNTSNAIRTLSALADEKLIEIDGRKIKLTNITMLKKISNSGQ